MKVNDIIVLEDKTEYLLVKEFSYENEKYFLANKPGDKTEVILKYIKQDNEIYVDIILNKNQLNKIQKELHK